MTFDWNLTIWTGYSAYLVLAGFMLGYLYKRG